MGSNRSGPSQLIYCKGPDLRTLTGSTPMVNNTKYLSKYDICNVQKNIVTNTQVDNYGVVIVTKTCSPGLSDECRIAPSGCRASGQAN